MEATNRRVAGSYPSDGKKIIFHENLLHIFAHCAQLKIEMCVLYWDQNDCQSVGALIIEIRWILIVHSEDWSGSLVKKYEALSTRN